MSELPLMKMVFERDFATGGEGADRTVKPIPRQYNLGPGDHAVALTSDSIVDRELSVMTVLDPENFTAIYPDYEERLMKSYVLCDWVGQSDQIPAQGWFSRSRLVPLSDEEFTEISEGLSNLHTKEALPDWFMTRFQEITDELASQQPDVVNRLAQCPKCQSRDVDVHWTMEVEGRSRASFRIEEKREIYTPQDNEHTINWSAHLHCNKCEATAALDEEEFEKPKALR